MDARDNRIMPPEHAMGTVPSRLVGRTVPPSDGRTGRTQTAGASLPHELAAVEAVVRRARASLVFRGRLASAARGFFWGSLAASCACLIARLAGLSAGRASWLLLIALAGAILGALLRRQSVPDEYRIAKGLDDRLGLKDRLAGGYDLARRFRSEGRLPETPFTGLILRDAASAADAAGASLGARFAIPPGAVAGLVFLAAASALLFWGLPGPGGAGGVSRAQREQVREFNKSLADMAEKIKAIEGLDDKQQKAMLDALVGIEISEDDLKKMSRADLIRRLREADAKIKLPEGVASAAFRRAIEDHERAVEEMDQVRKQLDEIEAINRRTAVIDLGEGRTASAANIKLESSDLQIDRAIAAAIAKPGEGELEYQKRVAAAEARAKAEREAIKRFLTKTVAQQMPEADVTKLAAMMANDSEFQAKVMEAIKDPNGKSFEAMRAIYRRQLEREFEKENIPRGLRQQLSTYLGR